MSHFVFRKHDNVGSAAAEHDSNFLEDCFVDTGDLDILLENNNPKRIIVGRTGAGKTALLHRLAQVKQHTIKISPHDLSLNFIATNKVISFFEAAGVNLTPFYVLLWKHILVVELIKEKYQIDDEASYKSFMNSISTIIRKKDRNKEIAIDYFTKWGSKFWQTTEQRIHELTERVEKSLVGNISSQLPSISFSAEGAKKLTIEQKQEIKEHGLDAVSRVQIRELENMLLVLEENIFDDSKNPYYVLIDMLDEDWADNRIKYKLIRSLIDSVNRFKRLTNVKIILALRQDLLYRVINVETTTGFQEEKYKALYLNLKWNKTDLIKIIELRLKKLIKSKYTNNCVEFKDIFPAKIDQTDTLEYMLSRTFERPRDIIVFINECLELCEGKPTISAHTIKEAEQNYSRERLQSLSHEWNIILPDLPHTTQLLYGLKNHFDVNQITQDSWAQKFEEIAISLTPTSNDNITQQLFSLYTQNGANFDSVRNFILREFFSIGLIGIKSGPTDPIIWTRPGSSSRLTAGQIRPSSGVYIHPMFYRALGIRQ